MVKTYPILIARSTYERSVKGGKEKQLNVFFKKTENRKQ